MKKQGKRALAVILTALLLLPFVPTMAADTQDTALRFHADGTFQIMIFADSHDNEDLEETTERFMCEALDRYTPDLVVYLGDNTCASGYDNQVKAIDVLTKPVRDRGVPFAMVFGNHDDEFGMSRDEIFEIYRSFGCLTYDADPALYGCGNCNLPILASGSDKTAFNLWFIDSGSNNEDTPDPYDYDYVHPDQIAWYKETAAALAAANGGEVVPAIDFQHIVIPEIYDKLSVKMPFSNEKLTQERLGETYSIAPVMSRLNGFWLEQCSPPDVYDGQYDAWKEVGDVIAEFHGHDHKNTYQVNIGGVDVINVPAVGCSTYYSDLTRGVGLITLHEKNPKQYDYQLIHIFDLALQKGSTILDAEGAGTQKHYRQMQVQNAVVMALFRICRLYYRIFPEWLQ